MLRFLFPRLTSGPSRGQLLFDRAVHEARQPHWYIEGGVPDTLDGRFAMVATICALAIVRVECASGNTAAHSAGLTECFVEAMDAEHRQMGINDPALGRKVRKMVGSLARRVEDWRRATNDPERWTAAVQSSVYVAHSASTAQLVHCADKLAELWRRLAASPDSDVMEGKF